MEAPYLLPESSFIPRNRLEELLVRLDIDPPSATTNEFYNTLLESKLSLVVFVSARLEELEEQAEQYGSIAPGSVEFQIDPDGRLYAFTALERAEMYLNSPECPPRAGLTPVVMSLQGRELISKVLGDERNKKMVVTGLTLNPYFPFCSTFLVPELLFAERLYAMSGDLQALQHNPIRPRITALPARHQPFANAVRQFCEQRPDVLAAYVGMVQLIDTKPARPFVWYYTAVPRPLYTNSLETLAQRLYYSRSAILIQAVTADSPGSINSPASLAVYFSHFDLAPVFQRT